MGFFQGVGRINMCKIEILTNNHFEMEGNKHCELDQCIISISNNYLDD
jgi:hypothetical protein